jgi:hypothetical protein
MNAAMPSTQHSQWCVGGTHRLTLHSHARHCACLDTCCARLRNNSIYECVCPACDGTCGAHLPNGPEWVTA